MPTILICDDEPHLRELMRISLDPAYVFAEAGDASEAVALAGTMHPDLVLLDVMMPGESGLSVIGRVSPATEPLFGRWASRAAKNPPIEARR